MKLHSPSCFIYFLCLLCQSNLLFVSSIPLQVTSTLPTLVTNGNSSTSDNYITTEWPRIDKVEPRVFAIGCIFCLEYGELSFPARCFWDVVEKAIKARNSVVGTVSRPFNWSTDKFFTGLETLYGHALKLILKTKKMFKSKCEQDSSCELD
ncbi:uncharacterized protein LOC107363845 [Tetranychus urticae]|uniref:uncharacterized protein LOC107363845 n=1 Tax=Tetranychus urticae TaxID=32264 RepID=UPI00077C0AC0|nr:uncharacterized protein LOC107363845 [Tetranychus urticae]